VTAHSGGEPPHRRGFAPGYPRARVRYELLLAAAAKNNRDAEKELPKASDNLLRLLGWPLRTAKWGQAFLVTLRPKPTDQALCSVGKAHKR
jgi:hypothetical protein